MTTARIDQSTKIVPVLHVAFELGLAQWKLAFTIGMGQSPRFRAIASQDRDAVLAEIALAKKRFGLPSETRVVSCYEAGRDGFWLHRWLTSVGVDNRIIDSSSIEVNRQKRRAKSDSLDADALVRLLVRHELGEFKCFRVVHVPSDAEEDQRHLHRELLSLKDERTRCVNQLKSLTWSQGLRLRLVNEKFPQWLAQTRRWDDSVMPPELQARLMRVYERWQFVHRQILTLEAEQRRRIREESTPHVNLVRRLLMLKGIGQFGAWMLVKELFAWRHGFNRKQLGSLVGLTPTPFSSGSSRREQGISKAGNKHLRRLLVELAWCWVRHQPGSELTQWFRRRFSGSARQRRVGITAVARKLLIALWRYLQSGEVPPGASLTDWPSKLSRLSSSQAKAQGAKPNGPSKRQRVKARVASAPTSAPTSAA